MAPWCPGCVCSTWPILCHGRQHMAKLQAGWEGTGTAPPDASHKNAHFPSMLLSIVSAPWIRSCQGMPCRQLVLKKFHVGAGPYNSLICFMWNLWNYFFYKTTYRYCIWCVYLRHAMVSLSLQFCQLACTFVISHCKCHGKALILKGKSK